MTMRAVPNHTEFRRLARDFPLVPVYCEVMADADTPVTAMQKLGEGPYSWLLESVVAGEQLSRYSFLGNSAHQVFRARGNRVSLVDESGHEHISISPDPMEVLEDLVRRNRPAPVPGLPRFFGGAVGYLSYDAARYFIPIGQNGPAAHHLPDLYFLIADTVLVFDHVRRSLKIVVNTRVSGDPDAAYRRALQKLAATLRRLQGTPDQRKQYAGLSLRLPPGTTEVASSFTRQGFLTAVQQCQAHIRAGEVRQVVLSQRLSAPLSMDPFLVYRRLRALNPSPYMFYLRMPGIRLVGSSPETLVRVEEGVVTVCPIAGTRRRGSTAAEDAAVAAELRADTKELREHTMLVEMGYSDLTQVCPAGAITVAPSMAVERYSHVMHLVSHVSGPLADGKTSFDALRATFPAGTVSGSPRRPAMQIIDTLEPARRGPYAGGVGYFGFGGNMDICIAIRCVVVTDGVAHVQAGAGIVAESDPAREYEETLIKAQAALTAVQPGDTPSTASGGVFDD